MANRLDNTTWEKAQEFNTEKAYKDYLNSSLFNLHKDEAKIKVENIIKTKNLKVIGIILISIAILSLYFSNINDITLAIIMMFALLPPILPLWKEEITFNWDYFDFVIVGILSSPWIVIFALDWIFEDFYEALIVGIPSVVMFTTFLIYKKIVKEF